jgi:hypothetical protein
MPQTTHQGSAKNVMAHQHRAHNVCGELTIVPHARQRGGSTPSTIARLARHTALAKWIVEAVIVTDHQLRIVWSIVGI